MKKLSILIITFLLILLTGCAAFFQQKVPMDFDSSNSYLEDLLVEDKKGGKLDTPSWLEVSKNRDTKTISLLWSKEKNAIAYRIEYAIVSPDGNGIYPETVPEELFNVLEPSWYETDYYHTITNGIVPDYDNRYEKRYFYRITALNPRDGYDDSDPTPSNNYGTLFAPPRNVKATTGDSVDFIEVSWNPVNGAAKYNIWRAENEKGVSPIPIGSVDSNRTSFKDYSIGPKDKGREFYYIIQAENKTGILSEQSSIAMGYTSVPGAPTAPKNVTITNGRGDSPDTIVLRWNAVQNEKPVVYNVYRFSAKDSALTKVGSNLTKTEFADKKQLQPCVYYYYVVQAVTTDDDSKPLRSPMSLPVEGFLLSPPENLKATKNGDKVTITFDKALGNEEEQKKYTYKILGCNVLDGIYSKISTVTDTTADVASWAFYKIQTIKDDKISSKESEIFAPAPEAATDIKVTHADYSFVNPPVNPDIKPGDLGVYPVKISWKKPAKDNPKGYNIFRSLKKDSGYRKISNDVVTELNYYDTDPALKPGNVYYYKVMSVNDLDFGENFSETAYGWGALTHISYLKQFNETIVSSQKKLTLMHKPGSTDKLGSETKDGTISGSVYYNAAVQGLGAYITMKYTNYADIYINPADPSMGVKFILSGNSDTSANMSSNGDMNGTITCTGMYPGKVNYNKIEIKAGAAGGGYYGVTPEGFTSKDVVYSVLEEK